ncbi:hypothetical protein SOVF_187330 [Spinacia oleracea]|nr:hypothetical protein SOVF_187330 [Spinacia oleracea]
MSTSRGKSIVPDCVGSRRSTLPTLENLKILVKANWLENEAIGERDTPTGIHLEQDSIVLVVHEDRPLPVGIHLNFLIKNFRTAPTTVRARICSTEKVNYIRKVWTEYMGGNPENLTLIHGKEELNPKVTLSDTQIRDGDTVYAVFKSYERGYKYA